MLVQKQEDGGPCSCEMWLCRKLILKTRPKEPDTHGGLIKVRYAIVYTTPYFRRTGEKKDKQGGSTIVM